MALVDPWVIERQREAEFRACKGAADEFFASQFHAPQSTPLMISIPITLLDTAASAPTRANPHDAGYDLYALEDGLPLCPGDRAVVRTGIAVAIPEGYYGRIAPRSGLAVKKGIDVMAGVIDSTFRGEVGVVLINLSQDPFWYKAGDRIAQLIIEKCHSVNWQVVDSLDDTARSTGGFGSSGS